MFISTDIPIYGLCPARDQFYVINCDICGQIVKYQALNRHMGMFVLFSALTES